MTKVGLVLSGGGAKGAYEIGVCLALKKLRKKIDIVTGTSIGAINGVFIAQNSLKEALKFWKTINYNIIFDEQTFNVCEDDNIIDVYKEYVKSFVTEGGMDVSKMADVFQKYFRPNKFYNSKIDYGLVTYNLTKHQPKLMKKSELSKNVIQDYVIASASCFPAFQPKKIDNDLYIDGGYYDNFPVNLAIEMGAEEIIGVDLRTAGFKREIINKGIPITIISPSVKLGSFLVFDKNQSKETIKIGYNDAMKKFGKLDGKYFTFKKSHLAKNYDKYNYKYFSNIKVIFENEDSILLNKLIPIKNILERKLTYKNFNKIIEYSGKIFGFKESKIYNIKSYNNLLLKELLDVSLFSIKEIKESIINKKKLNFIEKRKIVKWFYNMLSKNNYKVIIKFIPFFSFEFLVALYIYTVHNNSLR